jgi:transcriptional regulator with XRE-family HTH domain
MRIDNTMTDATLLPLIGARIASQRVSANLTQEQLAQQAGLGLRTIQRLELGATATRLSGFLRVCRVLGLLDRLETFLPVAGPGPMAQLQSRGRTRQRVRARKTTITKPSAWKWGEPS